ncbi:MAG TPA: membrane protein insertion efficiency factor YidD, partial [Actinomycetota bacterium]
MSYLPRRAAWIAGAPFRFVLLMLIRVYRLTLGQVIGGNCRFYPSCSAYAETAIANAGWARGLALSAWRVLRCNPFSKGGVDHPPARGSDRAVYD